MSMLKLIGDHQSAVVVENAAPVRHGAGALAATPRNLRALIEIVEHVQ